MIIQHRKCMAVLVCFLLPLFLHAKDDSGFYSMLELGIYKDYIQSSDKCTKSKQNVGKVHVNFGYEWQSGWHLGLNGILAGTGSTHGLSGIPLMRGIENLPYRYGDGVLATDYYGDLYVGYHLIRSTEHDMYINLIWNFLNTSILSYAFPFSTQASTGSLGLEIENRHLIMPKASIGYTLGTKLYLGADIGFDSVVSNDYARLEGDKDYQTQIEYAYWELYGDVKWIYHASKSADFFIKWDIQAQFVPKSKEVSVNVYDVLNRRSLGDVSLHTANYRRIRSGISFGAAF